MGKTKDSVAIDGPAGAGKSTAARLLSEELNYLYVDTGAMYRALTHKAICLGIDLRNESALTLLADNTTIEMVPGEAGPKVMVDGREVSGYLRRPEVERAVSWVARVPGVRQRLVELQREIARRQPVVMEGRDIGTCVLPDARFKFFLTASFEERCLRRWRERRREDQGVTLEEVRREIEARDRLDAERSVGPLSVPPDSIVIDTTRLGPEEVVAEMLRVVRGDSGS